MQFFIFLNHLVNFLAPAVGVGAFMAFLSPRVFRGRYRPAFVRQWGVNAVAGSVALLLGLVYFGTDGKMLTYGAMALFIALAQFTGMRLWRPR